ncbi:MAG: Uncharacterized protein LiPW15_794 [Parcubacteria group bacterium LiPW_15]|nr:MAG: Uncharacterized protein LiPW15_794 [Parcubacteria group bacterium LiPW_15]
MQFQVPQFIETEDKIIGPLTLRQFFYIAGGAALILASYFALQFWLWIIVTLLIAAVSVGFAFVVINGKPLPKLLLAAFNFYWNPQIYAWQPEQPALPKTEENMKKAGFSLEKIVAGMALNNAWRYLQTGSKAPEEQKAEPVEVKTKEVYQVFREITGERKVAKRVDYR